MADYENHCFISGTIENPDQKYGQGINSVRILLKRFILLSLHLLRNVEARVLIEPVECNIHYLDQNICTPTVFQKKRTKLKKKKKTRHLFNFFRLWDISCGSWTVVDWCVEFRSVRDLGWLDGVAVDDGAIVGVWRTIFLCSILSPGRCLPLSV